jgi:hypothetical protein
VVYDDVAAEGDGDHERDVRTRQTGDGLNQEEGTHYEIQLIRGNPALARRGTASSLEETLRQVTPDRADTEDTRDRSAVVSDSRPGFGLRRRNERP